jgi:hypothetical protein
MKRISAFFPVIVLALSACDTMNQPITSGDFDPLRAPGSNSPTPASAGMVFTAGQFVRTVMDNTAFFKTRPKGSADADKLLPRGTSMKVISHSDSFVKVELDSGEVGFVPSVMLETPNSTQGGPVTRPGEFQVYPPLNGSSQAIPFVAPSAQPPDGAIPTVIDPEAPAVTESFAAPLEPKKGPAPLPPNGKEPAEQEAPASKP